MRYRRDIDGLRAVAVLAVVAFHYFPQLCRGGFVGVDIFFVISGYLVTHIIYSASLQGSFSFTEFYLRRVRRLFPSLMLVSTVTLAAGALLLLANEFSAMANQLLFSLSFLGNFLFYSESGYFDKVALAKPFLHLWSLAIEEQFYLLWPPLIFLLVKAPRRYLYPALFTIFAASLIFNLIYIQLEQKFVFYLLPGRLWELAAGGILAVLTLDGKINPEPRVSVFMTWLGAAGITFSILYINNDILFPGYIALLPVFSSVLLIAALPGSGFHKVLSHKYLVYVGLVSYPLYLWHWPLLSLANIIIPAHISNLLLGLLILLSFAFAVLSFEFVEKKFRHRAATITFTRPLLVTSFVLLALSLTILAGNGWSFRHQQNNDYRKTRALYRSGNEGKNRIAEIYAITDENRPPTVALIGDSHANSFFPGLQKYYSQKGENLVMHAHTATPPLLHTKTMNGAFASLDRSFENVLSQKNIHTVVLAAFWESYYGANGVSFLGSKYKNVMQDLEYPSEKDQNVIFQRALLRTLVALQAAGKKVVFIHDTFKVPFMTEKCVPRPFVPAAKDCVFSRSEALAEQSYRSLVGSMLGNVAVFDPAVVACPGDACGISQNGEFIYSDSHHISISGAKMIFDQANF